MATSTRNMNSRGGDQDFKTQDTRGIREDKGVVIGLVKVNSHPAHMGVLSVFVPQFGNTGTQNSKKLEDDPTQWRQVRYASPWYSRSLPTSGAGNKDVGGIVYPAPDIGSTVLCVFPEGRNEMGFWFACAPDAYMMQALPEAGMTENFDAGNINVRHSKAPALDFNDRDNDTTKLTNFKQPKRELDIDSFSRLKVQGLDQDEIRGLTSSNYTRETPSEVFGITTKGRRKDFAGRDISQSGVVSDLVNNRELSGAKLQTVLGNAGRSRGHTFTMDDGDIEGNNNQVRIRTSHGHQILLQDTEDLIYIGNSTGSAWIQLDKSGQMDLYSATNINVRSANINFHADNSIKFHAKNSIQMVAEQRSHLEGGELVDIISPKGNVRAFGSKGMDIKSSAATNIEASGKMDLKAGPRMNLKAGCIGLQGAASGAIQADTASVITKKDTRPNGQGFFNADVDLRTTVDRVPTHEPYVEHEVITQASEFSGAGVGGDINFPANPPRVQDSGIQAALSLPNNKIIGEASITRQAINTDLGVLDADNVRTLAAGVTEKVGSNNQYDFVDTATSAVGKYGFNVDQLKKYGFVKPEILFNGQLSEPRAWTGKQGVTDLTEFKQNTFLQEDLFNLTLKDTYQTLATKGGIKETDNAETVSGLISAAYAGGVDNTIKFRAGQPLDPRPLPGTTIIQPPAEVQEEMREFFQTGVSAVKQSTNDYSFYLNQGLVII